MKSTAPPLFAPSSEVTTSGVISRLIVTRTNCLLKIEVTKYNVPCAEHNVEYTIKIQCKRKVKLILQVTMYNMYITFQQHCSYCLPCSDQEESNNGHPATQMFPPDAKIMSHLKSVHRRASYHSPQKTK